MDVSFSHELISFITQIGVANFLLVIFGVFVVTNAPSIVDRILNRRSQNAKEKQHKEDMTFICLAVIY